MTKININVAEKFAREALVAVQNKRKLKVEKLFNDYLLQNKRKTREDALKYFNQPRKGVSPLAGKTEIDIINKVYLDHTYSTANKVINNCKALNMFKINDIDLDLETIDVLYKVLDRNQIKNIIKNSNKVFVLK